MSLEVRLAAFADLRGARTRTLRTGTEVAAESADREQELRARTFARDPRALSYVAALATLADTVRVHDRCPGAADLLRASARGGSGVR